MTPKSLIGPLTDPLAGLTIAYTRAPEHWLNFKHRVHSLGAQAMHMPLLAIDWLTLSAEEVSKLAQTDYLIFTSINAVNGFFGQGLSINNHQQLVSIGKKTTQALIHHGLGNEAKVHSILTAPPPYDSEALLTLFQPKAKNIAIIAAKGGRQLLYNQLTKENQVDFFYTYQRNCNQLPPKIIEQSLSCQLMVMASCSTLDCLMENYPQKALKLIQCNICIAGISAKVADYAQQLGFRYTIHAHQASEHALIDAILFWWSTHKESEL